MSNIAILILAAGASSRLGQPKQLLAFKGKTLIRHAAETALSTKCKPVIVVTGALHDELLSQIKDLEVVAVHNDNWQQGMSTSIAIGIEKAQEYNAEAVLIMLCDQPLITSGHLNALCSTFSGLEDGPIVATGYNEISGVPAVFPKKHFQSLIKLKGEQGARELMKVHLNSLITVPFIQASIDVDTSEDYEKLKMRSNPQC